MIIHILILKVKLFFSLELHSKILFWKTNKHKIVMHYVFKLTRSKINCVILEFIACLAVFACFIWYSYGST